MKAVASSASTQNNLLSTMYRYIYIQYIIVYGGVKVSFGPGSLVEFLPLIIRGKRSIVETGMGGCGFSSVA